MTDMRTPPPQVWPTLRANDARALIRFLVDAFGFEEIVVHGDGRPGRPRPAEPGRWAAASCSARRTAAPDDPWALKPGTFGCYVVVDDIDKLHERAVAAGAEIARRAVRHRLRLARLHRAGPGGQPLAVRHLPRRTAAGRFSPTARPSRPRSKAAATAAARSRTPSFAYTCSRWVLTVASLMNSLAAVSRLVEPCEISVQHLELALAERLPGGRAQAAHQPAGDRRGQHRLAAVRPPTPPGTAPRAGCP